MSFQILAIAYTGFWLGYFLLTHRAPFRLTERGKRYRQTVRRRITGSRIRRKLSVFAEKRRRDMRERELSECLAYIHNVITLGRDQNMSRELLLEEMAEISDDLQTTFWEMARRMRLCEVESAEEVFHNAFGQDFAWDVAKLFTEWERIPPRELLSTVEAYRNLLLQRRHTLRKRRDEWVSDLAYFPVVVNAMVVLLNFIYVAYFIEQRDLLMGIL